MVEGPIALAHEMIETPSYITKVPLPDPSLQWEELDITFGRRGVGFVLAVGKGLFAACIQRCECRLTLVHRHRGPWLGRLRQPTWQRGRRRWPTRRACTRGARWTRWTMRRLTRWGHARGPAHPHLLAPTRTFSASTSTAHLASNARGGQPRGGGLGARGSAGCRWAQGEVRVVAARQRSVGGVGSREMNGRAHRCEGILSVVVSRGTIANDLQAVGG